MLPQEHKYSSFRGKKRRFPLAGALLALGCGPVLAGTIAPDHPATDILNPPPACRGADYVAGVDVSGHPVTPADATTGQPSNNTTQPVLEMRLPNAHGARAFVDMNAAGNAANSQPACTPPKQKTKSHKP